MKQPVFLISHRGALGDFLLTWPVIITLRTHFRNHRFVGFGKPEFLAFSKTFNLFDEIYDCESRDLLPFYSGEKSIPQLDSLDMAVCWMNEDPGFHDFLVGIGAQKACLCPPIPENGRIHAIDAHIQVLSHFSIRCGPSPLYLPLSSYQRMQTLIHPGSGSPRKNFEPDFYLFIANELANKNFPAIKFIIGPSEKHLKEKYTSQYSVIEPETISELASVISGSNIFIGNDSGVSHLSAMLGVRTIALFKSTDPEVWGVRGINAENVDAPTEAQAMAKIQKLLNEHGI